MTKIGLLLLTRANRRVLPSPPTHSFRVELRWMICSSPPSHHPAPNGLFVLSTITTVSVTVVLVAYVNVLAPALT